MSFPAQPLNWLAYYSPLEWNRPFPASPPSDFRLSLLTYDDTIFPLVSSVVQRIQIPSPRSPTTTWPVAPPQDLIHFLLSPSYPPRSISPHLRLYPPRQHPPTEDTSTLARQSTEYPISTYPHGQAPRNLFNAERRILFFF